MFTRILVPLDGSRRAESVLPAVEAFARACGASVALLHVIEKNAPLEVHDEPHLRNREEAAHYLEEIQGRYEQAGIGVTCHVHDSPQRDIASGIGLHVKELGADFVMMCTHGRSDLKRFMWGSIAQQVAAADDVPVFFLPPMEVPSPVFTCRTLMLPLDGKKEHETAIDVALSLGSLFKATILQVLVVPHPSDIEPGWGTVKRLLPSATGELLDQSVDQGKAYLDAVRMRFEAAKVTVSSLIVRGEPKKSLQRVMQREKVDLIIMGTHGRSGLNAALEGSVAPKISLRFRVPVIIVPAKENL